MATLVRRVWDLEILPALRDYIRIPNVSPAYDPGWAEAGHMERAVELVRAWCATRPLAGAAVTVEHIAGRTPVVVVEVPAFGEAGASGSRPEDMVLLYGHLDKQPPMLPWRTGLGPWEPVVEDGRLYGRGGADDGYAAFAALTALEAVQASGGSHARCVVLIEASEESGSPDLPAHVEALRPRLGRPSLVVCLDSWCATDDRLWLTTSLRGLVGVDVTVSVLDEGMHSGSAGGVVPSSFRVLRRLLSRVEDADSGAVLVEGLHVDVPADRQAEIDRTAAELGQAAGGTWPLAGATRRVNADDPAAQLRARTWEPTLEVVGLGGAPLPEHAGNVLRASTTAKLSVRLPPTCDANAAAGALGAALTTDPPYGATVTVETAEAVTGWNSPPLAPWLVTAVDTASMATFGRPARAMGEGGTIPFMGMLGERFPEAQFVITGVLVPGANAHGPNEFLDLGVARHVTAAVAHLLDGHAHR